MTIVKELTAGTRDLRLHTTDSTCEYQLVAAGEGYVLQLSTFGSDKRKGEGVTQTVQLTKEVALELAEIIHKHFGV